jgi:hypothetical protein
MTDFHTLDELIEAELEEVRQALSYLERREAELLKTREMVLARPLYGKAPDVP